MVVETSMGSIVIDAGLMFPKFKPTGIDQIIPDFTHIIENQEAFQGIVLTHGHEDHIGALPYLLKDAPIPVYSHPFTLELVKRKLREYDMDGRIKLIPVHKGQQITLSGIDIEFIEVEHSTIGCFALNMNTPQGRIIHSGDFRKTPDEYSSIDSRVRLFMCESTNAEVDPKYFDEDRLKESLDNIMKETPGAIIVSTFSSHVRRIKMLYDLAVKNSRRVAIMGRSINQVIDIASDLDFIDFDSRDIINPEEITSLDRDKVMIICTGTQGEVYSVLSLISRGWHKFKVRTGDKVIISARIIPGNEIAISRCIDQLIDFGAKVYYPDVAEVHTTGHASQEQIRRAISMLKPEIVFPIHGELRHMKALSDMVENTEGINTRAILGRPGQIWTIDNDGMHLSGETTHGKCFIDGELTGDIRDVVLRDRRHIAEGGLVVVFVVIDGQKTEIVLGPDIMCKGVVPADMEQEIMLEIKEKAAETLDSFTGKEINIEILQNRLRERLGTSLKSRLGKKPMIIPIIMEI